MVVLVPIDTLKLASLAVDGPLYGVFVCMVIVCGYDLLRRAIRKETQLSWPMMLAGGLLIVLATIRFILNAVYVGTAFLDHDTRAARQAYFHNVKNDIFRTRHVIFVLVQFVGDSFANYRCWVVWQKNYWVIAFPVLLSLVSTGCGSFTVWAFVGLPNQSPVSQVQWLRSFFSLSLVANALATSLLAFRIWSVDRNTNKAILSRSSTRTLFPVVRIVLESGLINAAYLFAFMMVVAFDPSVAELMCDVGTSLTGIIFSIVILRVSRRHHDDTVYALSSWKTTENSRPKASNQTASQPPTIPFEVYIESSKSQTVSGGSNDIDYKTGSV
ncbi:hypothetical protein C8Q80DRAFT_243316 [Daedaleopsis nitida]|nr:hypothetical protein C8Q80DRAFT_243316 [Daedaleopsis nitida]